jgi:hypothetical protein
MRAVNQGQLLAFQQYGVEYIEIITSGDKRVCPYCQGLHGKIYPIKSAKIPPFHPLCYDKDTEVFTNNGWKLFKDVEDDLILSMNPETHQVEFIPYIQKIEYHHKGEMYHIHNKWFDMKITPDHDVYTEKRVDHGKAGRPLEPFFVKPWELHSEHRIPRTCEYNQKSPEFININGLKFRPHDYAFFIAWYLSDGSILHDQEDAKRRAYPIKIAQQDSYGRAILKEGLERIGESLGLRLAVGKEYFEFYSKELYEYLYPLGGSYEKYFPNDLFLLSREHLNIFLNYLLSDGHERVKNNVMVPKSIEKVLFTTSLRLADDLSYIILLAGYYPSFAIHKMKDQEVEFSNGTYKINHDMFRISINRTKHTTMQNMTMDIVPYDDKVYCLELPKYHTLWVRRKGKTSWGGNCRCTIAAADKPTTEPVDIDFNEAVSLVPGLGNDLTSAIQLAKKDGVKLDGLGFFSVKEDQAYATINMLPGYRANSKLSNMMIEEYQSHLELFKLLNQALYDGKKLTAELKTVKDSIDAAMHNAVLKDSLIVFRGEWKGLSKSLEKAAVDDTFEIRAFLSTSMLPDKILQKGGWKSIILVDKGFSGIHVPSVNKLTGNTNVFTKQRELLLDRNIEYKILWKDDNKKIVIYKTLNKILD